MKNNGLTKNLLICADNLKALDDLVKKGIMVDLIYLDPPFFSNKHYEVIWGDEAEVRSFKDRWEGGIGVYIEWMRERVAKMYDVLKDTGSFYLHCDWHAGHYLKVMLDDIFGYHNFRNEIIWHYGQRTDIYPGHFSRKHDNVLFYAKTKNAVLNSVSEIWNKQEFLNHRHDVKFDDDGREFIWTDGGKKGERYKRYVDEVLTEGKAIDDVWNIALLNSSAKERLGYPTQKPEALLDRIVKASSNKNDIVLDPFCGCGTAMAVSQKLGKMDRN